MSDCVIDTVDLKLHFDDANDTNFQAPTKTNTESVAHVPTNTNTESVAHVPTNTNVQSHRSIEETRIQNVIPGRSLGEGTYGSVFEIMDPSGSKLLACKVPKEGHEDLFWREVAFLQTLDHSSIIRVKGLVRVIDSPGRTRIGFMMERYSTTLSSILDACPRHVAKRILGRLASAVAHVHSHGLVHCDIKPDNVLVRTHLNGSMSIRLCDFGYACVFISEDSTLPFPPCATLYRPPGISVEHDDTGTPHNKKEYHTDGSVDIWAFGVLALQLWTQRRFTQVQTFTPEFIEDLTSDDAEAMDFFKRLFDRESERWMTATDMLRHPFLERNSSAPRISDGMIPTRFWPTFPPAIPMHDWKIACGGLLAWIAYFEHELSVFYVGAQILSRLRPEYWTCPYTVTAAYMLGFTVVYRDSLDMDDIFLAEIELSHPLYNLKNALEDPTALKESVLLIFKHYDYVLPIQTFAQYLAQNTEVIRNPVLIAFVVCGAIFTHPPQTLASTCEYMLYSYGDLLDHGSPLVRAALELLEEWGQIIDVSSLANYLSIPSSPEDTAI